MNATQGAHVDYSKVDPAFFTRHRSMKDLLEDGEPIIDDIDPPEEPASHTRDRDEPAEKPAAAPSDAEKLLGLYHEIAAGTKDAVFVLTCITPAKTKGADGTVSPQRFLIGDVAGMAAEAKARGALCNVYFGPALMRRDLAKGRGKEADIVAVLSIVIEEDADTGKKVTLPSGVSPSFVVMSSGNPTLNRHFHFVFEKALAPKDAKELAELMHRKCGGDHGGKDIAHIWRVPETLNFPGWQKIERGRPETPQMVELIDGTGKPVSIEALRAALQSMPDLHAETKASGGTDWKGGGSNDRDAILKRLSIEVRAMINEEGQDRSAHCFAVMLSLFDAKLTDDEVLIVATGAIFARKFDERGDLDEEIWRARAKWKQSQTKKKEEQRDGKSQTQIEKILTIATDVELFRDPERTAWARIVQGGNALVARVDSHEFKRALLGRYYQTYESAPSDESLRTAVRTLEARAIFEGQEHRVALRVADLDGCLYLDLASPNGAVVKIAADGWEIIEKSPVRFWRSPSMHPLPTPKRGGDIAALAEIMNVASKHDFILMVMWALAALSEGPYPIAAFTGEQGTAKSTSTRILRRIIDPNKALLRSAPREERDLMVMAKNSHVLTFDNLSGLPAWLSDALAKLATGGGFSYRSLYSNDEEFIFDGRRPIIMNGIEDFATRGDLVDRCVFLRVNPIPEDKKKTERELLTEIEKAIGGVLGALLDGAVYGLAYPVKLASKPRMADFAQWAASCEGHFVGTRMPCGAVWDVGDFMMAYDGNRKEAMETVLDADSVGVAVMALMDGRSSVTGTATLLLEMLAAKAGENTKRDKTWPANARALSGRLKRLAPALRKVGVQVTNHRSTDGNARFITITKERGEETFDVPF